MAQLTCPTPAPSPAPGLDPRGRGRSPAAQGVRAARHPREGSRPGSKSPPAARLALSHHLRGEGLGVRPSVKTPPFPWGARGLRGRPRPAAPSTWGVTLSVMLPGCLSLGPAVSSSCRPDTDFFGLSVWSLLTFMSLRLGSLKNWGRSACCSLSQRCTCRPRGLRGQGPQLLLCTSLSLHSATQALVPVSPLSGSRPLLCRVHGAVEPVQ